MCKTHEDYYTALRMDVMELEQHVSPVAVCQWFVLIKAGL